MHKFPHVDTVTLELSLTCLQNASHVLSSSGSGMPLNAKYGSEDAQPWWIDCISEGAMRVEAMYVDLGSLSITRPRRTKVPALL